MTAFWIALFASALAFRTVHRAEQARLGRKRWVDFWSLRDNL